MSIKYYYDLFLMIRLHETVRGYGRIMKCNVCTFCRIIVMIYIETFNPCIYDELVVALYETPFKDIAYNKISCIFQG